MTSEKPSHLAYYAKQKAWLGYCPHGVCMFISMGGARDELAQDSAKMIRGGWDVRRGTVEFARSEIDRCSACLGEVDER